MVVKKDKLIEVYSTIRLLGGRGSSKKISEILGVSERTIQRYIKILVDNGYVEPVRYGMRQYYRVIKPLTESEAGDLVKVKKEKQSEPTVYQIAESVKNIIDEAGLHADLIGAAKIHGEVPRHSRITHDVDVIVAREHARSLVTMIKYGLGMILEKTGGVHSDFGFSHPVEDVKLDVIVDGFKENGRLVWDLSPLLRKGKLPLEVTLLAKLTRRSFRDADAYDVAVSLPHIDIKRFVVFYRRLKKENDMLASRVLRHLSFVREYLNTRYSSSDVRILSNILYNLSREVEKVDDSVNSNEEDLVSV